MADVLVMFSGSKDSMLASAILADQGHRCYLQTFDNGYTDRIERVDTASLYLFEGYANRIRVLPVRKITLQFLSLASKLWGKKASEIAEEYPNLLLCQAHCLICRSVMYLDALIYCHQNNIHYIADGARQSRGSICDTNDMYDRFKDFCMKNGVKDLLWPAYTLPSSGDEYESMLKAYKVPADILEPQCNLGCLLEHQLTESEVQELLWYFDNELRIELQKAFDEYLASTRK